MKRTILIMAGGTGGHVMPALAVADALLGQGWRVVWLGTRAGMEAKLVAERGFPIEWIAFSGLRRSGVLRLALLPFALLLAFWQAARAIFRQRPDVVLGMGGYTAFPGGMMAALLHRPLIIHEQNSVAGLTNRVLAGVADKVLVGFPGAFAQPMSHPLGKLLPSPKQTEWCGNPVRQTIAALAAPEQRYAGHSGPLRLLVVGGSQGAKALNDTVPEALKLLGEEVRPVVIHQAGAVHFEALKAAYRVAGVNADVRPFLDDMAAAYGWCDLVLCRAGALTVAEISAAGVASILVPYPYAVDDHQTGNAHFLVEEGAALLLPQSELTAGHLASLLSGLTRAALLAMAQKARALAKPDATRTVAQACVGLAG